MKNIDDLMLIEDKIIQYLKKCNCQVNLNIISNIVTELTMEETYYILCELEKEGKVKNEAKFVTSTHGIKMSKWIAI